MTEDVLGIDREKTAFNARSKASMRAYLKARTWPEKIESIERMNEAARLAREGMRRTRKEAADTMIAGIDLASPPPAATPSTSKTSPHPSSTPGNDAPIAGPESGLVS